jgi:heptosyltransferase II
VSAPERVLVRLPNWLGDVFMARPLLFGLRAALPRADVWCVGPAGPMELLRGDGVAEEWLAWPGDAAARRALLGRVRSWRPDLALVLPPSFSSAWFAWRAGAKRRVGYRGDARSPLLTRALPRPARGDRHLAEEYLALAAEAGVDQALRVPPPLATSAAAGGHALLGPGATYGPAKRWRAERFAEVGRALVARGLAVKVAGTAAERAACDEVTGRIGAGAESVAGATGLVQLADLAAGAAVAVCNDSGLAHVCAAAGAPTVVVFGSTSSAWTAPLGPRVRVVQRAPVCSPCFRRDCRIGYPCLEAVTVRDVLAACARLLAGREAA